VLAAFTGVVVWFGHQIHDFLMPPSDAITVPSFVGQTLADANASAQRIHLTGTVIDRTTSDKYPKDVIMNQRPEAGSKVREGRVISFVVSDGIIARLMPDVRYQSMREVNLDLARVRLQIGKITYQKSEIVPDGHVIEQDPAPLSNVSEGDTVNLVLSKGAVKATKVPNFIGMSVDDAREVASKYNITIGQLVWTPLGSGGPPHGTIARQAVPPGTRVNAYDPISLQVSAGPNESGYILRQVRVLASVPVPENIKPGDSVKLVLRVTDATGTYDAFRAYAQPGQKVDYTVTALGSSVVDMFVNDVLVGESRLGNEPPAVYDEKPKPTPSPAR
jgi:beta-lactam-binding protein with PASTA domain